MKVKENLIKTIPRHGMKVTLEEGVREAEERRKAEESDDEIVFSDEED
jgi:hypothetical protein